MFQKKDDAFFVFLTGLLILINGCTATKVAYLSEQVNNRKNRIVLNVPFIKQKKSYCGPAALSSVFAYWGYECSQQEIAKEIFKPELPGVLNVDLEQYAKDSGFWAKGKEADFQIIKHRLHSGVPVIVIEKLHPYIFRRFHYVVIVGFDEEKKVIIEHMGKKGFVCRTYQGFLRNWNAAGRWMLEVVPLEFVDRISDSLTAEDNIELGLIFEKKGLFDECLRRYEKAIELDTDMPVALFNIGNVYSRLKQWDKAEKAYLQALALSDDFADCYNNLAYVYLKEDEYKKAHESVDKALTFTSGNKFYYLDTKAQIFYAENKIEKAIEFFYKAQAQKQNVSSRILKKFYKHWAESFQKESRMKMLP